MSSSRRWASLDVRDHQALAGYVTAVADEAGRLDLMVNNAGVARNDTILTGTEAQWRELFDINVLALPVGAQAAVAAMRRTGSGGHIVNISSISALRPDDGVYGATKAAVNYLTEGLRAELETDTGRSSRDSRGPAWVDQRAAAGGDAGDGSRSIAPG